MALELLKLTCPVQGITMPNSVSAFGRWRLL